MRLPKLISNGMVLQQKKDIHIWGWDIPGRNIMVSFMGEEYVSQADEKGYFSIYMHPLKPGGPYSMEIINSVGEEIILNDIWVGDVWICGGAGMALTIETIKDYYPREIETCHNSAIRVYSIEESVSFHGPDSDHTNGKWQAAGTNTIMQFPAVAYFFALQIHRLIRIPIGIINTSADSSIESWMDRDMLDGYDNLPAQTKSHSAATDQNYIPTGLYNSMMAPCHNYTIAGIIWYQGESNADHPASYFDMFERLILGYRQKWRDDTLPFLYVQLPNYSAKYYPSTHTHASLDFAAIREAQRQALKIPHTGMVVTMDLEDGNNYYHYNQKEAGNRLAVQVACRFYDFKMEFSGPEVNVIRHERVNTKNSKSTYKIVIRCKNCANGLIAFAKDKGIRIKDFSIRDDKGTSYPASAVVIQDLIILTCENMASKPTQVLYCYSNSNKGALIYNKAGFPMSPFVAKL